MRMDAHSTRSPPLALALIAAATAFGLAACGGVAPKTATTVNPCATPGAGLPTLVCNLGTAHTYQDLAAYADAGFMHQGYSPFAGTAGAFVTRDTSTNPFGSPTLLTVNTPVTGTYNGSADPAPEHLYTFNLLVKTTVKVSLDPDNNPTGSPITIPFPVQQFSTQGAKIFGQATGAYYADLVQGTYNPKTGGEFYVLTLPGGDYVVSVSDCPGGCGGTTAAKGFTLSVNTTTAAPNLLFPGATPVGVQSLLQSGKTDQYYIAFAFAPLSLTGSPVTMTTGPFGIPVAKVEPKGEWLLYGDQQAGFTVLATVLTVTNVPAATPPQQVFVDVHGPGITPTDTIDVSLPSSELTISGGSTSTTTTLAPTRSPTANLVGLSGYGSDWTNVGTITFTGAKYDGQITVTVNGTPQTVTLPSATPPTGGSITLSCGAAGSACTSHTATLGWSGWTMPAAGKPIVQQLSVVGAESPQIGTVDGTVSASGSISTTEPYAPVGILGQRLQSEQSGDHVILQASKGGIFCLPYVSTSCSPTLPIP
jgi:hypothetical protein